MMLLAWSALALALLPLLLGLWSLLLFRPPPSPGRRPPPVSILIPARNEAATIGAAVRAALSSRDVEVEVVVLDDHSSDATAAIVRRIAATDPRLRLETAPPLPPGWCGKTHACHVLSRVARHPVLLFQDADVRLCPDAAARFAAALERRPDLGLVSGFPREETGSWAEHLVIPWIHGLLLGYLPFALMRLSRAEMFGQGCGQLIAVRRDAYDRAGGHAAIAASLHDGLAMPKAFRRAGFATDLVDATDLATCRMYRGFGEVWSGFSKNAREGLATPVGLPVWTVLVGGGHILPWLLLPMALSTGDREAALLAGAAVLANLLYRGVLAIRFRQHGLGVVLHPIGAALLLAIQWTALLRRNRPAIWRGRVYPAR